ncbi:MAG TPA: hypothetical protein VIC07_10575 [Acidimicrobiia bacterium]
MKRLRRVASLGLAAIALASSLASPALATEETTTTQVSEEPAVTSDVEPAVPVTTADASETPLDWTYRYMIPTGIVLAVLVILITTIQYFTSVVRKRYRIVKE